MPRNFFHDLVSACEAGQPFALGILSGVKGSSPQKRGAKALFFQDGRMLGTLGGGCLEAEVRKRALTCLRENSGAQFELVLDHDFGWDDGLICGGKVSCIIVPSPGAAIDLWRDLAERTTERSWTVTPDFRIEEQAALSLYAETVFPPEHLWIAGAGHVARAVAPLALQLDFAVTIFDDRPALANHAFFPPDVALQVDYWEKLLAQPLPSARASGLILTRGHQHDALVLSKWVHQPFAFLGMIGSKRKKRMIFSHFIQEGIATEDQLARVACPVGLPIGGTSVEEIALSIVAELVQKRSERRRAVAV